MNIVVDAFGGDNAPVEVLKGCEQAIKEYSDITITLTGDEDKIKNCAKDEGISLEKIKICHTKCVIDIEDDPTEVMKSKSDSSMAIGMRLLREGKGDAFVSAGSTGALAVGASMIVGRIKGIKRAALSPVMPSATGCFMLIDAGANLECRAEMLLQFGIMGSVYVSRVLGVDSPRVGLANVGAEDTKGTQILKDSYDLLKKCDKINFTGNVEAREIPLGACDVVVADGLSGNMILKTMEGTCKFFISALKDMFMNNAQTKIAALLMKSQLKKLKASTDYTEYGGAVFLGVKKPVIKAHGSSNANAFKNAIRQARECIKQNVVEEITQNTGAATSGEK